VTKTPFLIKFSPSSTDDITLVPAKLVTISSMSLSISDVTISGAYCSDIFPWDNSVTIGGTYCIKLNLDISIKFAIIPKKKRLK